MIKNFKWLFLVSLTFIACSEDDEVITYDSSDGLPLTAGAADFTKYVAIGNSLTAGFADNALFIQGQKDSYPNILASQFALVGGGEFKIPFMADNIGGFIGGNPQFGPRLYFSGNTASPLAQVSGPPTTNPTTVLTGGFNNFGVPGAKSFHLITPGYGTLNPYFGRFATSPTTTVIADAMAQNATFFSLWIGNNDVLSYATSGGTGVNQLGNLNPATYAGNDITDPVVFASTYNTLVTNLTAGNAKGVVANIPYVTSLPLFTTIKTNQLPGLPPANVTTLNQLLGGINLALAGASLPPRFVTLVADDGNPATTESNPLLIVDESLPNIAAQITAALTAPTGPYPAPTAAFIGNLYGRARHARNTPSTNRDYILLTAGGLIGTTQAGAPSPFNAIGISYPMQDGTVLTADEAAQVKTATDAFNASILSIANSKDLAFVDANATFNQVANGGIIANNFTLTSNFITGGAISMDGVHPSPRGYALAANKFIEAINAKYGSNLKGVNLGNYRILYPQNPANF
jgi:lysophospholipase L1-like esterase